MLQILFFAAAATIFFALLPAVLSETGISAPLVWKINGGLLICWYVSAITFRTRQSKDGVAWPFLIGVSLLIVNGFSMFLLLLLSPISEDET